MWISYFCFSIHHFLKRPQLLSLREAYCSLSYRWSTGNLVQKKKKWGMGCEGKTEYVGAKVRIMKSAIWKRKKWKVCRNSLLMRFRKTANRHQNKHKNRTMHCIGTAIVTQMSQSSPLWKRGIFSIRWINDPDMPSASNSFSSALKFFSLWWWGLHI